MDERSLTVKLSEDVIYRCIADEHILVPVGTAAQENNGLIVLNEVGAEVWKLLSQGKELDEIVTSIAADYDAEECVIRDDVQELLRKLMTLGLVKE